jgi:hypothetical protein
MYCYFTSYFIVNILIWICALLGICVLLTLTQLRKHGIGWERSRTISPFNRTRKKSLGRRWLHSLAFKRCTMRPSTSPARRLRKVFNASSDLSFDLFLLNSYVGSQCRSNVVKHVRIALQSSKGKFKVRTIALMPTSKRSEDPASPAWYAEFCLLQTSNPLNGSLGNCRDKMRTSKFFLFI